jgi:hypothetical protein
MTRLFCVLTCLLLLAGCVAPYPYYYPGGYAPVNPGYVAAPQVQVAPAAPPSTVYLNPGPVYEPGFGYIIIDPLPRFCCGGQGWFIHRYRGGDGRWHGVWRHR